MMDNILNQIFVLTVLMVVGIILRKKNVITDEVSKGMTNILMGVALPCLIISSFNIKFTKDMAKNSINMIIYSMVVHMMLLAVSSLLFLKKEDKEKSIFKFCMIFSNCGFVGYPIAQALYGDIGVFYTSIFTIPQNIFVWSYGVMLFSGEKGLKSIKNSFKNPPVIAVLLGCLIFIFSIPIPKPVLSTLKSVGNMTTPVAMFIIGAMLADSKVKEILSDKKVYLASFMKLIVAPALTVAVLILIKADKEMINICTILISMPAAILLGIFAEKYDGDKKAASSAVFMTTVLSLITIPLVIAALNAVL